MLDLSLKDMNRVEWAVRGWGGGGKRCHSVGSQRAFQPLFCAARLGSSPPNQYPLSLQIKVMHKQLLLFHNAISAYFAGNQQQLEQTLKQFNIKLKTPGAEKPSWLEEQ